MNEAQENMHTQRLLRNGNQAFDGIVSKGKLLLIILEDMQLIK